jgi:hypothetical protein
MTERRSIVRTRRIPIVAGLLSAVVLAGCGGGEEPTKVDLNGKTNTSKFQGMLGDQQKNAKLDKKR